MSIQSIVNSLTTTSKRRRAIGRTSPALQLGIESLEDRRMMAFSVLAELAPGPNTQDFEIALINPGGRPDLVYVSATTPSGALVTVRLGNSNGSFGNPITSAALTYIPHSFVAGDFTGDGKVDLITAGSSAVNLLVGNGNGTFQTPQNIALPVQISPGYHGPIPTSQTPRSVAVGDLNGDGKLDLTVGAHTYWLSDYYGPYPIFTTAGHVNVLLGNGAGGFATPVVYNSGVDRVPSEIAIADINGNGKRDVIAATHVNLVVLLGDGTGGLGSPINSGSGGPLQSISLGDIDGDGKLDTMLRANTGGWPGLTVHKGDGTGRFAPLPNIFLGGFENSAVIGDVNADGKLDLVAATISPAPNGYYYPDYTTKASVLLGNGQGGFSLPVASSLRTTIDPRAVADVALADFTGDGLPELAMLDSYPYALIIARNDGNWIAPAELSISDVSVVEGHSGTANAIFTVSRAGTLGATVSVDFSTFDYDEDPGVDYAAQAGTLTFAPGILSRTITVPVYGDRLGERDESFIVKLNSPTNALLKDGEGVGTILDDEPRISIDHRLSNNPLTVVEGDVGTTPAVFTVTLSKSYDQDVTVNYGTLTGHTDDIIAAAGTLRFTPGQTSKTITVQIVGDLLDEALEAFNLYLTPASANVYVDGGDGYCYIEDNDPSPPTISINDASVVEGNSGTRLITFTVYLSNASSQTIQVNYQTANGTATTSDKDYAAKGGLLTFAPGETSKSVAVSARGDKKKEANETFFVNLINPAGGTINDGQGMGTILNDDSPAISIRDASVVEGNNGSRVLTFTVTLSEASSESVQVSYQMANGTAKTGDSDFVANGGKLTFVPGQTSKTIAVSVTGDTKKEADETFFVNLLNPIGALIDDGQGIGTIMNDD